MNRMKWIAGSVLGALLLCSVLWSGMESRPVTAAPRGAPTPVAVDYPAGRPGVVTLWQTGVLTADGQGNAQNIMEHAAMDVQTLVDMSAVNTTTLTLQFSNDGENWVDGAAIGTNLAADTNTLNQYNVFGRFVRVDADLTNANPITITVIGVAK